MRRYECSACRATGSQQIGGGERSSRPCRGTRVQPAVQREEGPACRAEGRGYSLPCGGTRVQPACRAKASPDDRSYSPLLFAWSAAGRLLTRRSVSIWPEGHDHQVQRPSLSVWHYLSKTGNKKTRGLQCLSDVLLEPARMSLPLSLGYDTSSTTIRSMPG